MIVRPRHPSRGTRSPLVAACVWVLVSALYALRFHGPSRVVVVAIALAIALLALGLLGLSRKRSKLGLFGDQLVYSGPFRDRELLRMPAAGARVVDVAVEWGGPGRRQTRLWLLGNAAGHTEVGLNRAIWPERELEALRERLDLPLEVDRTPKAPAGMRRAYPGSIAWWAVHPGVVVVAAIVIVAILVLLAR